MEIVAVDRSLLDLGAADGDESDAVALSCVEWLLAETNACFQQRQLAQKAVQLSSSRLRDSILGVVFAASLRADLPLDITRFEAESMPQAEVKDRHAVRSVPLRSPERAETVIPSSSFSTSRAGSSPEKLRSIGSVSPMRRRRKMDKEDQAKATIVVPPIQTIERPQEDDENAEVKNWRTKCLKDLETATRKPGFSKWVTVARAFTLMEPRISMEVGVTGAPPAAVVAALAATPAKMKSNVDSFSAILDTDPEPGDRLLESQDSAGNPALRRGSRRPSTLLDSSGRGIQSMPSLTGTSIAENPSRQSKRRSQASNIDSSARKNASALLLSDSLSRRKLTRRPSAAGSQAGGASNSGWSSSRSLWRYENDAGSTTSRSFVPNGAEFTATTLPTTMTVASGVVLSQGEAVVEGPDWVEAASTMSRKRFELHQQLATDALLNAPPELPSPTASYSSRGSPLSYGHHPVSSLSELHFRDYEEVPAEPIPMPQLSPIAASSLAIPRTHLTTSLSTPSLRVRTSVASGKAGGSLSVIRGEAGGSSASITSNSNSTSSTGSASLARLKPRPNTALLAITGPPSLSSTRTRATSAAAKHRAPSASKYLREFPQPRPGVIRVVNDQATGLVIGADDRQRAWMS